MKRACKLIMHAPLNAGQRQFTRCTSDHDKQLLTLACVPNNMQTYLYANHQPAPTDLLHGPIIITNFNSIKSQNHKMYLVDNNK